MTCTSVTFPPLPSCAKVYCREILKKKQNRYVYKISPEEACQSTNSWFPPHHMVRHNGKDRTGIITTHYLNRLLFHGPLPPLLGVLLRLWEHVVAVSGHIKDMFHQIPLSLARKAVLKFILRDMNQHSAPNIYVWQMLPFRTTCSTC